MSETGFRCPACGNEAEFFASAVVLQGKTRITADGWDYTAYPNDAEIGEGAVIGCGECGHEGAAASFAAVD